MLWVTGLLGLISLSYFPNSIIAILKDYEMGFFKKLFQHIDTDYSEDTKDIYNQGVIALAKGDIHTAINLFEKVDYEHHSAAYNLGLIYLDGAGKILPDYDKAREYFQQADELGHEKARTSAQIIGFDDEIFYSLIPNPNNEELQASFIYSLIQFIESGQCGNLAYVLAHMFIIWNEKFTSYANFKILKDAEIFTNLINEFLNYEVYCIKKFANEEVEYFYQQSALKNFDYNWDNIFHISELSEYFNDNAIPIILGTAKQFHNKNLKLEDLGVLRFMMVNYVYTYCIKHHGMDFFKYNAKNEDFDVDNEITADLIELAAQNIIINAYRKISSNSRGKLAPTDKTTDNDILKIHKLIHIKFQEIADIRNEDLSNLNKNTIALKFLQIYENQGQFIFDISLDDELENYQNNGLRDDYKKELDLLNYI